MKVKEMFQNIGKFASKNAPALLIGTGAAGMLVTVVLAIKATPKAEKHIEEKKKELGVDELSKKDTVKACWKDYIPVAVGTVVSESCIIAGAIAGEKKAAGLLTMYTISEKALGDYKDAIADTLTKTKKSEVDAKVAEKNVNEDVQKYPDLYERVPEGMTVFIDGCTKQHFVSTIPDVKAAIAKVNEEAAENGIGWRDLNDILWEFKELDPSVDRVDLDIGWPNKVIYDLMPVKLPDDKGVAIYISYPTWPSSERD